MDSMMLVDIVEGEGGMLQVVGDHEEPAGGIFDGTILDWEEPVGAMIGELEPLWADLMNVNVEELDSDDGGRNQQEKEVPSCCICRGEKTDGDFERATSTCSHSGGCCRPCLVMWIEHCEASKPQRVPTCPTCAAKLDPSDILRLLGRPFQERATTAQDVEAAADDDEFLQTWLQENGAVRCPSCKIWATKIDGCERVQCGWCQSFFCFECGRTDRDCHFNDEASYYSYDSYTSYFTWNDTYTDLKVGFLGKSGGDWDDTSGLIETVRSGMKNARGGKKSLLWKGNRRKHNGADRTKKASKKKDQEKPLRGSRKRNARKKKQHRVVAQGLTLTA